MGVAYAFDSVHVLGFQYNGYYSDISANIDNSNNITNNGISQFTIHTLTDAKPLLINNSFNLVYNQKLDTAGGELFGAVQYGDFSSSNSGLINQTITIGNTTNASEKRNTSLNDIQLFTAQLDYNKGLSKKWKLETGLKDSYIINTNNSKFENLAPSGEWISDPAYYSGFAYKENVLAGYANLLFRKKKFHFRSGVRAELTSSDGFSYSLNSQVIDRQYLDFFPSAFAGYDFTSDLTAGVAYSSRIIRPTYQDMEPTVNYIDSLSSFRGNPYLKPEYTNAGEVSLTYMKEASITFGYSQTQGALRLVVDKLNNNSDAFVATTKNIDKATAYTLGLTIPYELDWWTTSNNFGYSFNTYSYSSGGQLIQNSKPLLYVYLYNEFSAKKLFSCEIIYDYNSGGVDGIFVLKPYSKLTATIKKTFLKDKLTCRIMFNDIFNSYVMAGNSNVQGYTVNYVSKMNSHFILLGLNYKFGKVKTPEYNDQSINKGEFERIKTPK
jgi:outer membrane receptor protein involved in Fe transport